MTNISRNFACALLWLLNQACSAEDPVAGKNGARLDGGGPDGSLDGDPAYGDGDRDSRRDGGGPEGCANAEVKAARAQPTIWLLVDRCLSIDSRGGRTDWQRVHRGLMGEDGILKQLEGVARFGLVLTGEEPELHQGAMCGQGVTVVEPALQNRANIALEYLEEYLFRGYCTPYYGLKTIEKHPRVDAEAIVLLRRADLEYVCRPEFFSETWGIDMGNIHYTAARASKDAVQALHEKGVKTFVLDGMFGVFDPPHAAPDPEKTALELAMAGGTKAPLTPSDIPELEQALREISGQLVSCDVTLNGMVKQGSECEGYVEVDGTRIPCNDENGWRLKDTKTVEITGTACEALKKKPEATVKADFPCDVIVIF